jgi:hypothetical protein
MKTAYKIGDLVYRESAGYQWLYEIIALPNKYSLQYKVYRHVNTYMPDNTRKDEPCDLGALDSDRMFVLDIK